MKNDFLRILKGSVITKKDGKIYLDLYRYNNKEIDPKYYEFINGLIDNSIITLDSGNFHTRESHYMLDLDYIEYKNNVKIIKLNLIRNKILSLNEFFHGNIIDTYLSIEKSIHRKYKLEKLNDIK